MNACAVEPYRSSDRRRTRSAEIRFTAISIAGRTALGRNEAMKRRGKIGCAIAFAALVAVIIAGMYVGRPKSLLDYATPVADTRDWQNSSIMNRPLLQFCWLSPNEV